MWQFALLGVGAYVGYRTWEYYRPADVKTVVGGMNMPVLYVLAASPGVVGTARVSAGSIFVVTPPPGTGSFNAEIYRNAEGILTAAPLDVTKLGLPLGSVAFQVSRAGAADIRFYWADPTNGQSREGIVRVSV